MVKNDTAAIGIGFVMLALLLGCTEPSISRPSRPESAENDSAKVPGPLPLAEIAATDDTDARTDAAQQPHKKSVIDSLLRAITAGAAEALDEQNAEQLPPSADGSAGN